VAERRSSGRGSARSERIRVDVSLQQARDPSSPNNVMITGLAPVLGKGLEGGIGVGRVNVGAVIECGLYLGRKRAGVLIRVYAECKYLLMRRAFESLNAGRVAVKTDAKTAVPGKPSRT
jgi:hypothetical protein